MIISMFMNNDRNFNNASYNSSLRMKYLFTATTISFSAVRSRAGSPVPASDKRESSKGPGNGATISGTTSFGTGERHAPNNNSSNSINAAGPVTELGGMSVPQ
jgi:hypothetical protein